MPFDKFNVLQQSSYGGFEKTAVDTEKMAKNAPKLEKIKAVITSFKETLKAVVATLGKAWEYIKSIFGEYGDVILTVMKASINFGKQLWETLGALINAIKVILNLDFSKSIIYSSLAVFAGILTTIVGIAKTFLDILKSILTLDFSGFGERVKGYFNYGFTKNLWNRGGRGRGIKNFFKGLFNIGTYATSRYRLIVPCRRAWCGTCNKCWKRSIGGYEYATTATSDLWRYGVGTFDNATSWRTRNSTTYHSENRRRYAF